MTESLQGVCLSVFVVCVCVGVLGRYMPQERDKPPFGIPVPTAATLPFE